MMFSFELKTGKKIELTADELSELIGLLKTMAKTMPEKIVYQSIPYFQEIYPIRFGRDVVTCGSV